MAVVNLGNIQRPPKVNQFNGIQHKWSSDETVGKAVRLNIPFVFSPKKTYIVFIRSYSGKVTIDESEISVRAVDVLTNYLNGTIFSGGKTFRAISNDASFGVSFPDYSAPSGPGIYILRPAETDAVALFNVVIYEL